MSDRASNSLVQRLRELAGPGPKDIFEEAALEIELLEHRVQLLRERRAPETSEYTPAEMAYKGCMGPCGQCETLQERRLTWAKECPCSCPACEKFHDFIRDFEDAMPPEKATAQCPEGFVPDADGQYQVDSCIYCGRPRAAHTPPEKTSEWTTGDAHEDAAIADAARRVVADVGALLDPPDFGVPPHPMKCKCEKCIGRTDPREGSR